MGPWRPDQKKERKKKETVKWIIKNSNVGESPIDRDTLLITDAESGVKWRVTKNLTEMFHATVSQ